MPDGYTARLDRQTDLWLWDEERSLSLVICDAWLPDNPIVFVSPEFSHLTGYDPSEAFGRNCRFLQGPGTDPAAVEELGRAMREERPAVVEILNYRKDGTAFWNALSIRPAYARNGRLTSFIGVQRVISRPPEAPARARTRGAEIVAPASAGLAQLNPSLHRAGNA